MGSVCSAQCNGSNIQPYQTTTIIAITTPVENNRKEIKSLTYIYMYITTTPTTLAPIRQ